MIAEYPQNKKCSRVLKWKIGGRGRWGALVALVFLSLIGFGAVGHAQTVTTLAGSPGAFGSLDATGAAASFGNPMGVAVDGGGSIYAADTGNNTIRKITPGGVVSTFAGISGSSGSVETTGTTVAVFFGPKGVALDRNGNVYVADSYNYTIRKITPSGVVTTFAGTTGASGSVDATGSNAQFSGPTAVAVDRNGNVYVADGDTIRKITPGGVVSAFAGSPVSSGSADGQGGAAQFFGPSGVAVDSNGNVYVADSYNFTIRKITPNGAVSTLAGRAGVAGSVDATGTAARFSYPNGVAVDGSGNVYVADNNTIRMITPAGAVTTLAGSPDGSVGSVDGAGSKSLFYQPNGVAVDVSGNVYVADTGNDTIRKIAPGAGVGQTGSLRVTITPAGAVTAGAKWQVDGGAWQNSGAVVSALPIGIHTVAFNTVGGWPVPSSRTVMVNASPVTNATESYDISTSQTVTTFAGLSGSSGSANGTGTNAQFSGPNGVAVDRYGNVYVADTYNDTIRKITTSGLTATFAGLSGNHGSVDASGTNAQFFGPNSVAVDLNSNVYVADSSSYTIRKITPTGVVTTLAGSAGVSGSVDATGANAQFSGPNGVAVDRGGNVYVADGDTIRMITSAGVVTTLAGSAGVSGTADATGTNASFNHPCGVAVDGGSNVYVADTYNFTIRKITPTGVVTTLAGSAGCKGSVDGMGGTAEFYNPSSVAVDWLGNVYVADNNTIRMITPAGVVTTFAGAPDGSVGSVDGAGNASRFNQPNGVAVDGSGNVYVADTGNETIRKIKQGSSYGQTGSLQVTIAPAVTGAQWQVDGGAWNNSGATVSGLSVGIHTVSFSAVNGVTPSNRTVTVNASQTTSGTETYDISTSQTVMTLAGSAGVSGTSDGWGTAAQFDSPMGMAVDLGGYIYVADGNNDTIRKVTPSGVVTTVSGRAGISGTSDGAVSAARFNNPAAVTIDGSGNVYVADTGNQTIRIITSGGVTYTLAGSAGKSGSLDASGTAAQFSSPASVAVDASGNVYVADAGNNSIRKITPGGMVSTFAGSAGAPGAADGTGNAARFNNPSCIAVDRNSGIIYVADTGNFTIRKITPDGVVTTLAGTAKFQGSFDGTGGAAAFYNPSSLALDSTGNVYVTDSSTIRKITPDGVVTTVSGDPAGGFGNADGTDIAARFNNPTGIAVDRNGNIYVSDTGNDTIRKISPNSIGLTGALKVTITPAVTGAQWQVDGGAWNDSGAIVPGLAVGIHTIAFCPVKNTWPSSRMITVVSGTTSATESYVLFAEQNVTTLAGSAGVTGTSDGAVSAAQFRSPNGITMDKIGNIYVADAANNTIRKITPSGQVTTFAGKAGKTGNIKMSDTSSVDGIGVAAQFNNPNGVAVDGQGTIYVADTNYSIIRKITPGGVVSTLAGKVNLTGVLGEYYYVVGMTGSVDGAGTNARFDHPNSLAVDGSGNVYVADTNNNTIRKITATGVVSTLAGTAGIQGAADGASSAAKFNFPMGVAVDGVGNVYVADTFNFTIRKITPAGVVRTLAGNPGIQGTFDGTGNAAEFWNPTGLALDGLGNVYVTDNSIIRKITPAGVVTTLAGDPAGSVGSADGKSSEARFYEPNGIVVDEIGRAHV